MKAVAWAVHHDAAAALFFATLDRLPEIDAAIAVADRAVALAACERTRDARDDLATLATRAQERAGAEHAALVTPLHLLRVASDEAGDALDRALERVGAERPALLAALAERARVDEDPGPRARYVVVVRGNDFLDASNTYDTLSDARRARAALRERAFGIPMGLRDRSDPTPFWLRIPERIAEATDVTIRDLEAVPPS